MHWTQEVANEIAAELASYFSFGSGRDSYVTDEQRRNVASNYKVIILKHSPFKPDTAYMEVPRCESCAWWDSIYGAISPGWGVCRGLNTAEKLMLNADVGLSQVAQITTPKDFGCVQWKAKQCLFIFPILIDGKEKQCSLLEGHEKQGIAHEWKEKR